jgi:hypothetical protein
MTNNEQIREVKTEDIDHGKLAELAESLGVSPEDLEDIDEETHGRLDEFYKILEEIKKRPDAKRKVAQIMGTIADLAGSLPEDPPAEKSERDIYADEARRAADDLADAFAIIVRRRKFIPTYQYKAISDAMNGFIALSEWESNDDVLAEVLPYILWASIWGNRPDHLS